jgi:predicted permease
MKIWPGIHDRQRKERAESQLDSELRAYVDMVTDERVASGMSAPEARRTALADFGGMEQVKQAVRDERNGAWFELLCRHVRNGVRQLVRNPGFTLTVVVTLALAIGANTAIFSIVNALMLKSLPYAHPERMGTIYMSINGGKNEDQRINLTGEQWELLRDNVPSLLSAISGGTSGVNLNSSQHVQFVHDGRISAHYLDVLGIKPVLGRNFTEDEDRPHGAKSVILSYGLWQDTFGADRGILGQAIDLKGEPYTVVGILPRGAVTPNPADLFTPLQPSRTGEGGGTNFEVIARLRDGANWQRADAEINRAWAAIEARFALRHPGARLSYYSVPLQKGQTDELRPKALVLMLAAGLILLIACANLAGLTLVRMLRRTPEVATRMAVGATRWQIQQQLWVENLLLALAGGAAGVGVGYLALHGLLSLLPVGYLPVAGVPLDARVLAFTLAASLLTSMLFGVLPALAVRKVDLRSSMSTRGTGGDRFRLRQAMIAGQVALTVVLLAGAGLLIRTLVHLETLPPGFNPNGVMTAKASLDDARYHDPAAFRKLLDESIAATRRIPGVENAAVGLTLPFEPTLNDDVTFDNGPEAGHDEGIDVVYVTPGYFDALRIPLLTGRDFNASDGPNALPVAVVNRTFVQKFFHGQTPIGHSFNKGVTIVGVVGDVQLSSNLSPTAPLQTEETAYFPAAQVNRQLLSVVHVWFEPSWIVRTAAPVPGLPGQMQRALSSADPGLPFSGFYGMSNLMAETLFTQRIEVALLGAMAGLALLLSAVGIFALVANMVAQRTREIGIRLALGSSIRRAMVNVGSPGVRAAGIGLALGLVLCAFGLRAMRSVLYGVAVYDAATIAAVIAALVLVTIVASTAPTLRIASIDPAKTLREE